jgi:hypothetical protein
MSVIPKKKVTLVTELPAHRVNGLEVVVRAGLARVGQLRQELYYEIEDPASFIEALKKEGPPMDIFTFLDRFPQPETRQPYHTEYDNFAVIPITTYEHWHKNLIPKATRRGLRKAQEAGIRVDWAPLDDRLIQDVTELFNECPVRQGRPFWHYGKNFDQVKEILSRDLHMSRFLVARIDQEFVGLVKLITRKNFARTTLIMSKIAHRASYPNNALVEKCVQICAEEHIPALVYGQMEYGTVGNKTLADFKSNNGFTRLELARYFVPLSGRGSMLLRSRLHHGLINVLPKQLVQACLRGRALIYSKLTRN